MQDVTLDATDFITAKLQNGQNVRVAGKKVFTYLMQFLEISFITCNSM